MARKKKARLSAKERRRIRSAAASLGWKRRKKRERAEAKKKKEAREKADKKRLRAEKKKLREGRTRKGVPKSRRTRKGRFLPAPTSEVERAWELRRKWDKKYPDRVRVFYVDGIAERRFTVDSWDRFMSDEDYEDAREAMLDAGSFVLGIQGEDGDMSKEIETLA